MSGRMRRGSVGLVSGIAIGAAIAIGSLLAGVAVASIPASNGVISGCYSTRTGALRIVDYPSKRCVSGEKLIRWNQTGPAPVPLQPAVAGSPCTLPDGHPASLQVQVDRGGAVTLLCYPVLTVSSSITLATVVIQDTTPAPDKECDNAKKCSVAYAPGTVDVHVLLYAATKFAYQCPGSFPTTSFYDVSHTRNVGECVGVVMDGSKSIPVSAA